MRFGLTPGLLLVFCLLVSTVAQAEGSRAQLEVELVPTGRAQMAIWVENGDGEYLATLALTRATATMGIGNRPGASHMNSGYRWPYGRRENVLPIWGNARADAPGAEPFKRVIFQDRSSEGYASRTSTDHSVDNYYCLSFERELSGQDALDATTCASVFSSDKGRFVTKQDVDDGYAEPTVGEGGETEMRALGLWSLYPPRRDVRDCDDGTRCNDHPDAATFAAHALEVMPELDAVSRATPAGGRESTFRFDLPNDWDLDDDYTLKVEVNVEGDYDATYDPESLPPPSDGMVWDHWALSYGYPYRGQPSVVYSIPIDLREAAWSKTLEPTGYGDPNGFSSTVNPMDDTIEDDTNLAKGSGADRLIRGDRSYRARARVLVLNPCAGPEPDPGCDAECSTASDCNDGLTCADGVCVSDCLGKRAPAVKNLKVEPHPNPQRAHTWAVLSFQVPESDMRLAAYRVRIDDGYNVSDALTPDADQPLMPVALDVCAENDGKNPCMGMQPGDEIEVVLAELSAQGHYTIEVEASDANCGAPGDAARVEYDSPAIEFATVSPCFVASAAYGSPLAPRVGVLRRARDRYLMANAPGRALVDAYYAHGEGWAHWLRETPRAKQLVRRALDPVVGLFEQLLAPDEGP